MNDGEYKRKAVQLADGWSANDYFVRAPHSYRFFDTQHEVFLDSLAAQLVRQVEKTSFVSVYGATVSIEDKDDYGSDFYYEGAPGDRTMSTIKAIIDSGVLE